MRSILIVSTAPISRALTTLSRVKYEIDLRPTAEEQAEENEADLVQLDSDLWALILEASEAVERHTNRTFALRGLTQTLRPERGDARQPEALILGAAPVTAVTSVTLDDEALDAEDYELSADSGLLYRLCSGYSANWSFCKSAAIVFQAGYVLPVDAWVAGTAYFVGATVSNGGNVYACTVAGEASASGSGPTGTGAAITDGTVTWAYQGAAATRTLPRDVEDAVCRLIKARWRSRGKDPFLKVRETPKGGREEWWIPDNAEGLLPPDVRELLEPYVLHAVA